MLYVLLRKLLEILIGFPLSRNTRKERYAIFNMVDWLQPIFDNSFALYFNFKSNQGVSIGGGIGSVSDMLDSAQLICEKVSLLKLTTTDSEILWWSFLIQVFLHML